MSESEIPDTHKPPVYFDVSSLFRPKDNVDKKIEEDINAMIEIAKLIDEDRLFLVDSYGIRDTLKNLAQYKDKKEKIDYALKILAKKKHLAPAPRNENQDTDGFSIYDYGNKEKNIEINNKLDILKKCLSEEDYKIAKFVIGSSVIQYFITSDEDFSKAEVKKIVQTHNKKIYAPIEFLKYFNKVMRPSQDRYLRVDCK